MSISATPISATPISSSGSRFESAVISGAIAAFESIVYPLAAAVAGIDTISEERNAAISGGASADLSAALFGRDSLTLSRNAALRSHESFDYAAASALNAYDWTMLRAAVNVEPEPDTRMFRPRIPMSSLLPLRTTAVWGSYGTVQALPLVYGRVWITPIPYDATATVFHLGDHYIGGVEAATRDNAIENGWRWLNTTDRTGHPVAMFYLNQPLKPNEKLAVRLRGKCSPATGELLTNPVDVVLDLMMEFGIDISGYSGEDFRSQCDEEGLPVAGRVGDPTLSIRSQIDQIFSSIGAVWSPALPGLGFLFLNPESRGPISHVFTPCNIINPQAVCESSAIATAIRLTYNWRYDWNSAARACLLNADPATIDRYGYSIVEHVAPWLTDPRAALSVATRLLSRMARPQWQASWQSGPEASHLRAGEVASITHPNFPNHGFTGCLQTAEVDHLKGDVSLTMEIPGGTAPGIEIGGMAEAWQPLTLDGVTITYQQGVVSFKVLDDSGNPMAGAAVTLDQTVTHISDRTGTVQFQAARGKHYLLIKATGFADIETEVTV